MSLNLSQVINTTPIPVNNSGSANIFILKTDMERGAQLPASTEEVLYENAGAVEITYLEFATNNRNDLYLRYYFWVDGAWKRIASVVPTGASRGSLSAEYLVNYSGGLFDIISYDTELNKYKLALSRPIVSPNGVKISLENTNATDACSAGCLIIGRTF